MRSSACREEKQSTAMRAEQVRAAVEQRKHRGHLLADAVEQVLLIAAPAFGGVELARRAMALGLPLCAFPLEGLETLRDRREQRRVHRAKLRELLRGLVGLGLEPRLLEGVLPGLVALRFDDATNLACKGRGLLFVVSRAFLQERAF